MKTTPIIFALAICILLSTTSYAQPPQDQQGKRSAPPQEAIDACDGKEVDTAVSFETPRGDTLDATCKMINGQLIAVPANCNGKPRD